jgi:hypothetical protein
MINMHDLYKLFWNMCYNTNKQTNNSIFINEKWNMELKIIISWMYLEML